MNTIIAITVNTTWLSEIQRLKLPLRQHVLGSIFSSMHAHPHTHTHTHNHTPINLCDNGVPPIDKSDSLSNRKCLRVLSFQPYPGAIPDFLLTNITVLNMSEITGNGANSVFSTTKLKLYTKHVCVIED